MKKFLALILGIGLGLGGTVFAAQISVPSAVGNGYYLISTSTGAYIATTTERVQVGTINATSTTADSVFPRLSVTNSTTTNATSTSFFSSVLSSSLARITSLFLPSLATPAGTLIAVDNNGQVIATTTPTGGGTPGGADTNVQFRDGSAFGGESGFTYQKSPTELVTMANGTVSGELRSNSLHETSAGVVGLNLDTTNITAQIGSSGFFKLKDGTTASELSIDTAALTGNHTIAFQDADGTVALLSNITGASTTLYADNGTFTGSNIFTNASTTITNLNTVFSTTTTRLAVGVVPSNTNNGPFMNGTGFGNFTSSCNNCGASGGNLLSVAAFGSGVTAQAGVNTFSANGTAAAPSASQLNDNLYFMGGRGFGATVWNVGSKAAIGMKAAENFTDTANGTYMTFEVTPKLSTTRAEAMRIDSTGFIGIGTSSPYARLSVVGETVSANFTATSTTAISSFQQLLVNASTTLQNFTGLRSTTTQATSTNFFASDLWGTRMVVGNATATGVIAVQGTGTSTYTGGIRALTAQFDALTAASCDLKADTSGNMYCGTDATGGAGGSSASTTSNFSIYKSGNTYYAYNATTTGVTSNASFSVLLQSVVDLMDAGKGGGSIYIQAGTYYVTSTTTIQGNGTAFDTPGGAIRIWGAGVGATKIVTTGNADFLAFDSVAVPMVSDLTVYMNGTSHAFYADSSNNAVRSMWMFYFANMQITSTSSATAVPLYLGNALRGLITNIEFTDTAGCAYFYSEGNWNPGDFDFIRSFCELQTTSNLVAFNFASTTSGGYMNQVHFDMVESIATGIGQTFMRGAPVKFSSFTNLNAEQFDTLVDGYNVTMKNDWDFNYATHRTGVANLRGCRFGNTLNGVKGLATLNTCTFKFLESDANFAVVDDMNTDPTAPNIIRGFFGSDAGTAIASTSATTLTIFRDISFYGTLDNNLAPSGLAGVFQTYGPLQTRSSKTASSSIRSDATSTFQTGISISTGCFAIANVCLSSSGSGASSTLLVDNNTFSGNNMFTGSSTILSFTALRSTTTAATTTNLTVTNAPIFTALTGLLKGNGSSPLTAAVNGTDFTLITAKTCTAGDFVSAVTAAGVFTCSTPTGGGGGGSGIGWTWNSINSLRMTTTTDDLLIGASATSSNAKQEVIKNGLIAWFASTTGATIRPIFTAFRDTSTGISGIGINSSSTEDAITINGTANFDPMFDGCDLIGIGTVTTDQLSGQLCDWLALDSVTDGGILMGTPNTGIEANMPFYTILRSGDTTSWAANEGVWLKSHRAVPATTTVMVEALLRTPNVNVATTTGTYVFGLGNVGAGSLTTTAAYAAPTNTCSFQASSTANWIAVVRTNSTYNAWDVTVATSTTQSTFRRFRITQDLNNGCRFYVDGTLVASEAAATSPVVPMQFVLGEGNNGAGVGTIGTTQNHYFYFAEQKMGWGRWQAK